MNFFNTKHRTDSTRLKEWDYSSSAYYFITICTKYRKVFLGRVVRENIELSEIGEICNSYWSEIPKHFRNATLDEYIVMPNHIHGILIIDNPTVETRHGVPLQDGTFTNKFSKPISGSLSVIINQYKSSVTRWCRNNGYNNFGWQRRFYEHIIRNEKSLNKIREYIKYNPLKWEFDKYNPDF